MNDTSILKDNIRKATLAKRDALSADYRSNASEALVHHANKIDFSAGDVVSGFYPIRSEIDVRPLIYGLEDLGALLCLPVVLDKQTIEFRLFSRSDDLVPTGFGTFGPGSAAKVVDPNVMLIPLSAFDNRGNRIGYGAGFYDRAIARLHEKGRKPRLIGVAFECQRVETVPYEAHDVPLDTMLTENGIYHF